MYLVYVGKECIFKCTLFKSHLHAFLYPQVHVYLLLFLHPHILIPLDWCVLVDIRTSVHHHILRFMCACLHPGIFKSLCHDVHACLHASVHPHILIYSDSCIFGCILTCFCHIPSLFLFTCILASSHLALFFLWDQQNIIGFLVILGEWVLVDLFRFTRSNMTKNLLMLIVNALLLWGVTK